MTEAVIKIYLSLRERDLILRETFEIGHAEKRLRLAAFKDGQLVCRLNQDESIDLLELAVSLNARFKVDINDGEIFLTRLRAYIAEAEDQGKDLVPYLVERLPFLSKNRIKAIIPDLEGGPTLKVRDLVSYVAWQCENG